MNWLADQTSPKLQILPLKNDTIHQLWLKQMQLTNNPQESVLIGVISDTHGLLLEEAVEALRGSELILHAGDVGNQGILDRLEQVAPVLAVRGNMDHGIWSQSLPESKVLDVGGLTVYMLHDLSRIKIDPKAEGFGVVISGHTHQPLMKQVRGVLFLNPGTAGVKSPGKPLTLARVVVSGGVAKSEIISLEP
jgi:putative phosphoesterase